MWSSTLIFKKWHEELRSGKNWNKWFWGRRLKRQILPQRIVCFRNVLYDYHLFCRLVLPINNFDFNDKIGFDKVNSQRIQSWFPFRLFIEYWKPFHQSVDPQRTLAALPMIRPMLMMKTQVGTGIHSLERLPFLHFLKSTFLIVESILLPIPIILLQQRCWIEWFFYLRQLNEGLRHCWRPSMCLPLQISWNYVREPTNVSLNKAEISA